MMRAMHLPVRTGSEEMIGSTTVILDWRGHSGHVRWNQEIWQARGKGFFKEGDEVVIQGLSGLILQVKPISDV